MKPVFYRIALLGFPLLPLCQTRAALNPAIVAADSRWVVCVDVKTLRDSTLGREVIDALIKKQLQAAQGGITFDPGKILATVETATAYGAHFSSNPNLIDGVLLIQGTPDFRKIVEGILAQATITTPERVSELKDVPFSAYAITGGQGKNAQKGQVVMAFPPEPIVLVSKSIPQLIKALDVFRGVAPSLDKNPSSPLNGLLGNAEHSYLFAASVVPLEKITDHDTTQSRVLQMVNSGSATLGENGTQTFAHLELNASSGEKADKLMKILQGMTAMMSLAETNDQQLNEFLNSATVSRDDDRVMLNFSYASARIVQMIQNFQWEPRAVRPARANYGKVIAEWKTAPALPKDGSKSETVVFRTIENVHLVNGTTVTLTVRLKPAEMQLSANVQLNDVKSTHVVGLDIESSDGYVEINREKDVRVTGVEIVPPSGLGSPLHFRPEYMKLTGYRLEKRPSASGVRPITAILPVNTAQFQFPGEEGSYTLKVGYMNGSEANASFAVSIKDPEPAPADVHSNDDAGDQGSH